MHGIGKIAVSAEILSKPTRLSEAELAIIKGHSQAGHDQLEPAELPELVAAAVLQHHERLDGSGYPDGCGVLYDAEVCDICLRLFREEGFSFVE